METKRFSKFYFVIVIRLALTRFDYFSAPMSKSSDWHPDFTGDFGARVWFPDLIKEGEWHHVVIVLNRQVQNLLINGFGRMGYKRKTTTFKTFNKTKRSVHLFHILQPELYLLNFFQVLKNSTFSLFVNGQHITTQRLLHLQITVHWTKSKIELMCDYNREIEISKTQIKSK